MVDWFKSYQPFTWRPVESFESCLMSSCFDLLSWQTSNVSKWETSLTARNFCFREWSRHAEYPAMSATATADTRGIVTQEGVAAARASCLMQLTGRLRWFIRRSRLDAKKSERYAAGNGIWQLDFAWGPVRWRTNQQRKASNIRLIRRKGYFSPSLAETSN